MGKILLKLNEQEDNKLDILAAIDRNSLIIAANELRDLYHTIYNYKIYEEGIQKDRVYKTRMDRK